MGGKSTFVLRKGKKKKKGNCLTADTGCMCHVVLGKERDCAQANRKKQEKENRRKRRRGDRTIVGSKKKKKERVMCACGGTR